jgi:hypothetical protein
MQKTIFKYLKKQLKYMAEDDSPEDITELAKQAKVVAEATGRDEADVLADLLDDGIVNNSHKAPEKDLVTQLKEAAELITTVQSINQEVSENRVLNGGDNSTEVKVETTLEGDIVDRAIASVHRKAENIKKIALIVAPVLLLLTGGSMEAFGLTNWLGSDDDDYDDDDYYVDYGGCTAPDADNYDPMASWDDGSCYWHDNNGGGGGPPHQSCDWQWSDSSYTDDGQPNTLFIVGSFSSFQCPHEMEGDFRVHLFKDGQHYDEDEFFGISFRESYDIYHSFEDLEEGDYTIQFRFDTYDGSNWNWDSPNSYYFEQACVPSVSYDNLVLITNNDDLTVEADFQDENGCGAEIQVMISTYLNDAYVESIEYEDIQTFWISEVGTTNIKVENYDGLKDLEDGNWKVEFRFRTVNGNENCCEMSNEVEIDEIEDVIYGCTDSSATNYDAEATEDDGSCEYPEPEDPCDVEIINHYRGHVADDAEQDAILVAFRVVPSNCEGEQIEIDIQLFQNGYDANYSHWQIVSGDVPIDISHTFDGVAVGNSWTPTIIASLDSDILEQVWFWGIDIVEQEPETCEINLFGIQLQTNNTSAVINFDLDCGYDTNDLEGYNVSVQFLVYHVNETNSGPNATGPLEWTTQTYYIQGYADDVKTLLLDNFTVENTTHYDFYWYAIWEDADGNQQYIEQTWLNREINP